MWSLHANLEGIKPRHYSRGKKVRRSDEGQCARVVNVDALARRVVAVPLRRHHAGRRIHAHVQPGVETRTIRVESVLRALRGRCCGLRDAIPRSMHAP